MTGGGEAASGALVVRAGPSSSWSRATGLLTSAELDRVSRLHRPRDRHDVVAARALARIVVAELVSVSAGEVELHQLCATCGSTGHGRPRAVVEGTEVCVSWSHAGGGVAAVASTTAVGIDVEPVGKHPVAAAQLERLGRWTRTEALVKIGAGTLDELREVDLDTDGDGWGPWRLASWLDDPGGLVVSLATVRRSGTRPDRIGLDGFRPL